MDSSKERQLVRLMRVVDMMRMLDATLPIQTFSAFLVIATKEGQNVTEIGTRIGLGQSSASRNVSALTEWDWRKKVGLKLVEYRQDPMNLSIKTVWLTAKGKAMVEQITETLER